MIRRLAAALALVAIGISVPVAPLPVHAARWADGPCTDNIGITVVIDFQELEGGVNVRCATGPATSGLDALDKAGIVWEGARRFPGVVCRIAGKPAPATEACNNTPPATAYWSYWVAPRGGSWCYSSAGAGNRTPPPGTIEGWSFALDRVAVDIPPPRFEPPAPIPGEAPNQLNGADCGSPAAAPNAPPATPAPTNPPPTNAPPPPAAPQISTVLVDPDSASTVVSTPSQQAAGGPTSTAVASNAAASPSTTGSASTSTTSAGVSTTTRPPTTSTGDLDESASTDTASAAGGSVPLGTVDLSDDGRGDGGFSPAAGLGLLIAAGVGGTSVWAARRRRGAPS